MTFYILMVFIIGAFVGFVSGMFGLGGGGLIVPALLALLPTIGVTGSQVMFIAMGTAFATMIISTGAAAYNQYQNRNIAFFPLRVFLPTLLLTVLITSQLVTAINQIFLKITFSCFLIYLGGKMLMQTLRTTKPIKKHQEARLTKDALYAFAIGVIATLGSISGAGLIVTYFDSIGMPLKKAIGTASFCGMFLTIIASLGFIISGFGQSGLPSYSLGFVHLPTVVLISFVSIPTSKIGVRLMLKLSDTRIKIYFASFLIILSSYIIIHTLLSLR